MGACLIEHTCTSGLSLPCCTSPYNPIYSVTSGQSRIASYNMHHYRWPVLSLLPCVLQS
jgi:hypothetical protein